MYWYRDTLDPEALDFDASGRLSRLRLRDMRGLDAKLIAETILLLPAVQLAVRVVGLQRTVKWTARLTGSRIRGQPQISNVSEIERITRLIRGTCRQWPFRATCLDRSLVTVVLLGRRGIPVTFCVGFRKSDAGVEGHAWVEHNARPVAEAADVTVSHLVFARYHD
jgi:Transglutaminase-like superfamily